MANFLDATAEIEQRIHEYELRLARIAAHLQRGEKRAARARLGGLLEELVAFSYEIELPLETIVVGAQLGFFSGGELFRGRLPGTLLGAAAGWLYGQQVLQRHRLSVESLAEKAAALTLFLEAEAVEEAAADAEASADPDAQAAAAAAEPRPNITEEIEREAEKPEPTSDRVTLEVDRD